MSHHKLANVQEEESIFGGCRTDRFSVEILRPSGNMIILGKFPIPWRVCVYVYVVRSDVAVKRVFYGDNNSDINV